MSQISRDFAASSFFVPSGNAQDKPGEVVIGQTRNLESEILDETRTLKIWLPESYTESGDNYPVFICWMPKCRCGSPRQRPRWPSSVAAQRPK